MNIKYILRNIVWVLGSFLALSPLSGVQAQWAEQESSSPTLGLRYESSYGVPLFLPVSSPEPPAQGDDDPQSARIARLYKTLGEHRLLLEWDLNYLGFYIEGQRGLLRWTREFGEATGGSGLTAGMRNWLADFVKLRRDWSASRPLKERAAAVLAQAQGWAEALKDKNEFQPRLSLAMAIDEIREIRPTLAGLGDRVRALKSAAFDLIPAEQAEAVIEEAESDAAQDQPEPPDTIEEQAEEAIEDPVVFDKDTVEGEIRAALSAILSQYAAILRLTPGISGDVVSRTNDAVRDAADMAIPALKSALKEAREAIDRSCALGCPNEQYLFRLRPGTGVTVKGSRGCSDEEINVVKARAKEVVPGDLLFRSDTGLPALAKSTSVLGANDGFLAANDGAAVDNDSVAATLLVAGDFKLGAKEKAQGFVRMQVKMKTPVIEGTGSTKLFYFRPAKGTTVVRGANTRYFMDVEGNAGGEVCVVDVTYKNAGLTIERKPPASDVRSVKKAEQEAKTKSDDPKPGDAAVVAPPAPRAQAAAPAAEPSATKPAAKTETSYSHGCRASADSRGSAMLVAFLAITLLAMRRRTLARSSI